MRFFVILLACLSCAPLVKAQTAGQAFIDMPSDIMPALDKDRREYLVANKSVATALMDVCVLDTLTAKCLKARLSDRTEYTLVYDEKRDLIFTIKTYSAPEKESVLECYGSDWGYRGRYAMDQPFESFISDTLSQAERDECLRYKDDVMYTFSYSIEDDCLIVTPSFIAISSDDRKLLNERIVIKKFDFCNITAEK